MAISRLAWVVLALAIAGAVGSVFGSGWNLWGLNAGLGGILLVAWKVVSSTVRGKEPEVVEEDERDLRLCRAANALLGILIVKSLIEHAYLVSRYAWDRR